MDMSSDSDEKKQKAPYMQMSPGNDQKTCV